MKLKTTDYREFWLQLWRYSREQRATSAVQSRRQSRLKKEQLPGLYTLKTPTSRFGKKEKLQPRTLCRTLAL